ncbi:MAG: glycosyltransferase [Bauldia sp.]
MLADSAAATSTRAIVLCADMRYFPLAFLACRRLVQLRNRPSDFDVFLLTERGEHLNDLPPSLGFIIFCPDFVHFLPEVANRIAKKRGPFSFLRFFVPDLLPQCSQIIYLDCDIRIERPPDALFDLNLGGATIAAADDPSVYLPSALERDVRAYDQRLAGLGLSRDDGYFGSGVLLIDAESWRRRDIRASAMDLIARTEVDDQDALNIIFRRSWLPLSPRWNFESKLFGLDVESVLKPVIYHFAREKPWRPGEGSRAHRRWLKESLRAEPALAFRFERSFERYKRLIERRCKEFGQLLTFFLPSSHARLEDRSVSRMRTLVRDYVLRGLDAEKFGDVTQNIGGITAGTLKAAVLGIRDARSSEGGSRNNLGGGWGAVR